MAEKTITITADEGAIATAHNALRYMANALAESAEMQAAREAEPKSKRKNNFENCGSVEDTLERVSSLHGVADQMVVD